VITKPDEAVKQAGKIKQALKEPVVQVLLQRLLIQKMEGEN